MEENIVKRLINKELEYRVIEPNNHKIGTGSNLSVKVVIPSYCQANCDFCFNNLTRSTQVHNEKEFLINLRKSLDMILKGIDKRKVTLDVTGNEPTFNILLFKEFLETILEYKSDLGRIIVTSNGYNLDKCIDYMLDVINIMNISVHHYDYEKRKEIFKTSLIPSDEELRKIVKRFSDNNIKCTSVAVLNEEIKDFRSFYNNFVKWSKEIGFKDTRMRSNFIRNDKYMDDIINTKFDNEQIFNERGLITKIINEDDYEVRILKGVDDLTKYVIGAELVIDDDGKCYIDYSKRYPINEENIKYFNNFYIIDEKKLNKKL